ncbi:hypothetical protein C8J56DRAFT_1042933 [Mycena floridula]|nr:hypothetical protein C8J56DRAFT_1042933 [Mycena floridula]
MFSKFHPKVCHPSSDHKLNVDLVVLFVDVEFSLRCTTELSRRPRPKTSMKGCHCSESENSAIKVRENPRSFARLRFFGISILKILCRDGQIEICGSRNPSMAYRTMSNANLEPLNYGLRLCAVGFVKLVLEHRFVKAAQIVGSMSQRPSDGTPPALRDKLDSPERSSIDCKPNIHGIGSSSESLVAHALGSLYPSTERESYKQSLIFALASRNLGGALPGGYSAHLTSGGTNR